MPATTEWLRWMFVSFSYTQRRKETFQKTANNAGTQPISPAHETPRRLKALPARFFLKGIKRTEGSHPFKENLAGDADRLAQST